MAFEVDNMSMRDQQAETLLRHCDQIEDERTFLGISLSYLEVKRDLIKEAFDLFRSFHGRYRAGMPNNMVLQNDYYEEIEEKFMRAMSKISERLDGLSGRHESSLDSELGRVIRVETARPPKLMQFDGDPAKWPAFHDLFMAEVHSKDFDLVTKLLYLQECCIGRASATLGTWKPTGESYEAAWELMKQTYSDEYQIKQSIIDGIFKIKSVKEETHDNLRAILDAMSSGLRQLRVLGVPVDTWDDIMINVISQRLPGATLDSWEQKRIGIVRPTLEDLRNLIESKARGRRALEGTMQNYGNSNREQNRYKDNRYRPYPDTRGSSTGNRADSRRHVQNNGPVQADKCPVAECTQNHFVYKCDLFKRMGLNDKLLLVRGANLCRCCLRPGHRALECEFSGCSSCPDTKWKHNYRICSKLAPNVAIAQLDAGRSREKPA